MPTSTSSPPRVALTLWLFAIETAVSLAAVFSQAVLSMVSASCGGGSCNLGLVTFSGYFSLIATGMILIATIGLSSWRRTANVARWRVPLVGTAAVVVVFFVSWFLLAIGVGFTLPEFFGPQAAAG